MSNLIKIVLLIMIGLFAFVSINTVEAGPKQIIPKTIFKKLEQIKLPRGSRRGSDFWDWLGFKKGEDSGYKLRNCGCWGDPNTVIAPSQPKCKSERVILVRCEPGFCTSDDSLFTQPWLSHLASYPPYAFFCE